MPWSSVGCTALIIILYEYEVLRTTVVLTTDISFAFIPHTSVSPRCCAVMAASIKRGHDGLTTMSHQNFADVDNRSRG